MYLSACLEFGGVAPNPGGGTVAWGLCRSGIIPVCPRGDEVALSSMYTACLWWLCSKDASQRAEVGMSL